MINCGRLRPILRLSAGERMEKVLKVDRSLVKKITKHDTCNKHYLRADCYLTRCKHIHIYPRPLSRTEYDALWTVAR